MSQRWIVGCGQMGGAMLARWIAAGWDARAVTVIDPGTPRLPPGVRHLTAPPADAMQPDLVVLGVKPQSLDAASAMLRGVRPRLLISILAGIPVARLSTAFDAAQVLRAMPNLPVAIGAGVVGLAGDDAARAEGAALMAPLGLVEWLGDEALFDALTALSGCGPGFVFRVTDALAAGGVALGLDPAQAARLATATVAGAGAMAQGSDVDAATLADRVASPGGSTREGLNVLDADDALRRLFAATLRAAHDRNVELGRG